VSTEGTSGRLALLAGFALALDQTWSGGPGAARSWLDQTGKQSSVQAGGGYDLTAHFLPALLLHPDPAVRASTASFVPQLARLAPSQSLVLVPLILLRLNKETDATAKHALIHAIPSLATDAFSIGPVLRTLQTTCNAAALTPLSVRLMFKLWRAQERTFPNLLATMQSALKSFTPGTRLSSEISLSLAMTIW